MIDPNLITTVRVGELPPSPFSLTDKIPHEVGADLKSGTIDELIAFITPFIGAMQYEVITLHVNTLYITSNFDDTGLGVNLMLGYAICNGNNGTINKDGRVGVAYGVTSNVVGLTGGSRDAVVVAHSHTVDMHSESFQSGGNTHAASNINSGAAFSRSTSVVGVSGTDKNMQPYLVELQVMRL